MKKFNILFEKVVIWASVLVLFSMVLLSLLQIRTKDFLVEQAVSNPLVSVGVVITSGFILFMCLIFLYNVLKGLQEVTLDKIAYIIFAGIILLQAIILIFFVRAIPIGDSYRNIVEAMRMAREGVLRIDNTSGYYAGYANNNGFVIMLYGFYRILLKVGINDLWISTIVLNVLFIDLGILFSYLFARKAFSRRSAAYFMILVLISPTTYCFLTFAYTNTFSIFFMAVLLWMSLGLKKDKVGHICCYCFIMGLIGAIGYVIRPTTIIVIIAIGIMCLRVFNRRKLGLVAAVIFLISCALCIKIIGSYNNQFVVDKSNSKVFPITHWIMLGVSEKGGYNPEDYAYTQSFPTKEEKIAGNLKEIKSRIKKNGTIGMSIKWLIKLRRVWGDGNDESYNINICTENCTKVFDYMYGEKSGLWSIYSQAFRFITLLAIFVLAMCIRKKNNDEPLFMLLLTLFGAIVFFLIWEANNKYSISFSLIMALLMERGMYYCSEIKCRIKSKKTYKSLMLVGVIGLILFNTALFMKFSAKFTDNIEEFKDYSYQDYIIRNSNYINNFVKKHMVITQKFKCEKEVSSIALMCKKLAKGDRKATNVVSIYDNNEKVISKKVNVNDIKDDNLLWIHMNDNKLQAGKTYVLEIKGIKGQEDLFGIAAVDSSQIDYIKNGSLYVNDEKVQQDLYMIAYSKKNITYTTKNIYYMMYGFLLIGFYIIIYATLKEIPKVNRENVEDTFNAEYRDYKIYRE